MPTSAPTLSVVATPSIDSPPTKTFRISSCPIQAWREVNEMPDGERDRAGGPASQMETR